jgi:hypothetical protein
VADIPIVVLGVVCLWVLSTYQRDRRPLLEIGGQLDLVDEDECRVGRKLRGDNDKSYIHC